MNTFGIALKGGLAKPWRGNLTVHCMSADKINIIFFVEKDKIYSVNRIKETLSRDFRPLIFCQYNPLGRGTTA